MEKKFSGVKLNGFLMLFLFFVALGGNVYLFTLGGALMITLGVFLAISLIIFLIGLTMINPNDMRIMLFFGKYKGTLSDNGFCWVNPFYEKIKLTSRASNIDIQPIKVNDKCGNPVMIGLVLVWRIQNAYKATFEIDSYEPNSLPTKMKDYLQKFVSIQSESALRNIASKYSYDNNETHDQVTLRSGGDEIAQRLEEELNERLGIAGIEVLEARISYLAYAPEIAAIMLRRQQASAIIAAREKIVEGAVSMVKMALEQLSKDNIVELDNEKKAAMVSNLLVVLCSEGQTHPVINAGTLHQ